MASDLKDLKGSGVETVKIKYKKLKDPSGVEHRVGWKALFTPWDGYATNSRLESSWRGFQRILNSDSQPFTVEEKKVGPGDGEVTVKWHVWDDAGKLSNAQVEHYSVMRAEERFIGKGYKKTASKYFCLVTRKVGRRKFTIPSENSGIDSFFVQGSKYVVCESKFTRDESVAAACMASERTAWGRLGYYKKSRQMSWEWIEDRAGRAAKKPAGLTGATPAQQAGIRAEVRAMRKAILLRDGVERYLNIWGSSKLPVFPGTYVFRSVTNHRTENQLNLKWTLSLSDKEFIQLGDAFDDWCNKEEEE